MIPLRDNAARHRLSLVNTVLIAINTGVFALQASMPHPAAPVERFALIPALLTHASLYGPADVIWPPATLITSQFLHANILHLGGNMLYLFIFGPAVEERLGHARFFLFYLIAGLVSGLAMVFMTPGSMVPIIGASGAIAGALGAYLVFFPRARLLTILPLFTFIQFIEIPAVLYLILWFAVQLFAGIGAHSEGPLVGGVAWWAHVSGFLFGMAAAPLVAPKRSRTSRR